MPITHLAPRQARPGDVDPLDAVRAQRSLEALVFYLVGTSIRTWIRGLDASGRQIEGEAGPSEFRKTSGKLQ